MRPWGVRRLFRFPIRSAGEVRRDVADEVDFHLDMRADELLREGLTPAQARAQARREYGDTSASAMALAQAGDQMEHRRHLSLLGAEFVQDVRQGLRLLRRSPGFATVAILTLALGIGANTAIYSALDAAVLHPLPYPEPDRLVQVSETVTARRPNAVSGGVYLDWRAHQTQFAALTLTNSVSYNLRRGAEPERLSGLEVSHEFLQVLGISPLLGRGFLPDEDRVGGNTNVVLLSEELWQSHFGADPAIVGRSLVFDEVPRIVVGVLPSRAWLFREHTFFVPAVLVAGTSRAARTSHWAMVFGRLAQGSSVAQADAELNAIKQQLHAEYPAYKQDWGVMVQPVTEVIGGATRTPLFILMGAVSLVLLIACANVANLLLARGCHREQELAVRAAIGASGGRLVRQILTENLTLAGLGGIGGLAVAYAGVGVILRFTSTASPLSFVPHLDVRVLLFSLVVSAISAPLVGLLPALRARRLNLTTPLNSGSKGAAGSGQRRTQSMLIVAEVMLTVVLLASAGLLLRSLANAAAVDSGFEPARVLAFDVSLPDASYSNGEKRFAYVTELLARLRALPGVTNAGSGMGIPFSSGAYGEFFRRPDAAQDDAVTGRVDFVSADFLEALGARLKSGRNLEASDDRIGGPRVAVISAATARHFFPDNDAIGATIVIAGQPWQVVGVVADIVDRQLDLFRQASAYLPRAFNTSRSSIAVRTSLAPMSLVENIRAEMARLDAGVAMANPRALDRAMAESMTQRRVVLVLVALFAAIALLLAAIGLYGVMAYAVATRRREFGIRMAFGATRAELVREVLGGGLRVTGIGLVLGLGGAVGAAQLLASQLYQVDGFDPLVMAGTASVVLVVAVVACWIPALRASRLNPMVALRGD